MQIKLLHSLVEELAGIDTGRIVDILFNKKDVNEFLIAKRMDLTINQVRNILYKLSADGLVSFTRKKDKRKGWYIYYWTLKTEKCLVQLEQSLIKKIEGLKALLNSRETKRFYVCKSCNIEVSEEKALESGFACDECAEIYELQDNSQSVREAKAQITRREKELKLIDDELKDLRVKEGKKRTKKDAAEKKLKEREKKSKKASKKMAKKKLVKKVGKKLIKKKAGKKSAKKVVKKKTGKKKPKKKLIKKKVKKKK